MKNKVKEIKIHQINNLNLKQNINLNKNKKRKNKKKGFVREYIVGS